MEAKSRAFTFLGNEALIRVPFFQRPYVWKKDNWEELLDELNNLTRNHFLGSIILKQQQPVTGEPKEALIIDGQQRLTTLSLLLKALYDSFSDTTKANVLNAVRNYLFYKKEQTDTEFLVKMQHSQLDAQAFELVMRAGLDAPELKITSGGNSRILQCYFYFLDTLLDRDQNANTALFNWLTKTESEILVVIDLGVRDDEQAIFDTINSAGVHLSSGDIIKNALFQRVIQLENQKNAIAVYEQTWKKVMLGNEDTTLFWEKKRSTGRLKRDNIELLLHSIAVIKGIYDPDVNTLSDLSGLYKDYISNLDSADKVRKFINEITEYAEIYRSKIPVFDESTMFSFDDYEKRLFHVLECLEISTFHPYILYLYKKLGNEKNELKNSFRALESMVVRRVLSKHEVKSFNKFCKEFIDNPNAVFDRLTQTNETDFVSQLKSIANRHASLLLFWIELRRRSLDARNDITDLKYCYSLEHIMPQKWQEHWKLPKKVDADGFVILKDVLERDRWDKIYWIGNMTLLTTNLNSTLKNFDYKTKMAGEGRKKGIKDYADLRITRQDLVSPFDSGDKVWDEDKIFARTNSLITEINSIWEKNIVPVSLTLN